MTKYKTEDGRLFASGKFAAMYYTAKVGETIRFLEGMADALDKREDQLSPETDEVLENFVDRVMSNELMPDMRACLRAWEAYESE